MLVIDSFGKNIYIGPDQVGYVDRYGNMFVNGKKASLIN
jgi:hypothetical protein